MTKTVTNYLLRIDSKPIKYEWEQLSNGVVRAFGVLGKVGHPLEYYQWDGSDFKKRVETIEAEQLFNEDSLQTAWGMPVTLGHTPGGLFDVNSDNLLIGSCLQEFRKDEANGELGILLTIHDKRGIELIQSEEADGRFAELSPTYFLKSTGIRSDGVYLQQGRKYDSIALLRQGEGRGGSSVRLRVDSKNHSLPKNSAVSQRFFTFTSKKDDKKLMDLALKVDGKDKVFRDVDDTLATEVKGLLSRVDSLESQINTFNSEKSALQAKLDSTKLKLTETEEKLNNANNQRMDSNAIAAELDKRAEVWDLVEPVLSQIAKNNGKSFRRDNKLSVAEIQRLFLSVKAPHLKLDGKDEVYITTAWDCLKPTAEQNQQNKEAEKQESITRVDSLLEELNIKGGNSNEGIPNLDAANDNARNDYINSIENKGS